MPHAKLVLCLLVCSGWSCVGQAFELFSGFEASSLGPWSVAGDEISVTGLSTWTAEPDRYRWLYFGASEVENTRPEFRVPADKFLGNLQEHRFVWSYDQEDWAFFDNHSFRGRDYAFGNDTPFTQDEVYVAYSTPYTVTRTTRLVSQLADEWFVFPTENASPALTVGSIQELPLYGFRLTNPLITAEKTKVVLVSGNHSGEMGGSYALEGLLEFLSSDDVRAKQMRNVADFYVYPMVDPLGRSEGYYRGNSQNPGNDHNRFWDAGVTGNNGGFAELDILSEAMREDTSPAVDFTFDFHGFFSSDEPDFLFADTRGTETTFFQELQRLDPTIAVEIDDALAPAGILEFWAKADNGLNSDYAFTPEFSPNRSVAEWKQSGLGYGLALFAELERPSFRQTSEEIDVISAALRQSSTDLRFDLNRDRVVNDLDREFLLREILHLVVPGDTNLDGSVDFADFLRLSGSFGIEAGWEQGDFDGNGTTEFTDFLTLSGNFGRNSVVVVAEPCGPLEWSLLLVGLLVARRTGFPCGRNRL